MMKQLVSLMAVLALLAFSACSDDDNSQIPKELCALNFKTYPGLWRQSDASVGVLLPDLKASQENQFNSKYSGERDGDTLYLKPADVSNTVLLPSDGSSLNLISYQPYSDQLDKENLSLSIDLREQEKWYADGFRASNSISISAPVDTAVLINMEDRLATIDLVVREYGEGDIPVKLTKDNIYVTKAALSGTYSFQSGKFENLTVFDRYPFSLFDESGRAKGVFIPTDDDLTVIYIDENGKEFVLPIRIADGSEIKGVRLLPGTRIVVSIIINNQQQATASLSTKDKL
ncbi:fimbrillin family protein [uncultured Parabacteroides sp.]|uniref:fimbrillin family protein n=1 Tax=uncultured Parabacteroides sp. TaxID=512312 RepID=UPI0025E7066F|nr:fimbrillin family protein [uncultured Parabacteroides sp.]